VRVACAKEGQCHVPLSDPARQSGLPAPASAPPPPEVPTAASAPGAARHPAKAHPARARASVPPGQRLRAAMIVRSGLPPPSGKETSHAPCVPSAHPGATPRRVASSHGPAHPLRVGNFPLIATVRRAALPPAATPRHVENSSVTVRHGPTHPCATARHPATALQAVKPAPARHAASSRRTAPRVVISPHASALPGRPAPARRNAPNARRPRPA
jgi:hypothetical protein